MRMLGLRRKWHPDCPYGCCTANVTGNKKRTRRLMRKRDKQASERFERKAES